MGARRFREITEAARDDLSHMLDSWRHVESSFLPEDDTNVVHLLSHDYPSEDTEMYVFKSMAI